MLLQGCPSNLPAISGLDGDTIKAHCTSARRFFLHRKMKEDAMRTRLLQTAVLGSALLAIGVGLAPLTSAAQGKLAGIKVCVDPGHGGSDPGAVNLDFSLQESAINLDVAYGLKSLLEAEGAEVVLTRQGDEYKTNADRYTFCNEEQATILVSVHTNSVTEPSWDGSMALYAPSADSALAEAMYPAMYSFLRDTAPPEAQFQEFACRDDGTAVHVQSVRGRAFGDAHRRFVVYGSFVPQGTYRASDLPRYPGFLPRRRTATGTCWQHACRERRHGGSESRAKNLC